MIVAIYLIAIVAANLTVAHFGPAASIAMAFLFIGLDLSLRDRLHDAWQGRGLAPKMGALIVAGGALSYLINRDAGRIALASCAAFAAAALADGLVYHLLRRRPWLQRANGSNMVGATVDSLVFPWMAFGGLLPWVVFGQLVAKIAGGAVWAWLLGLRQRGVQS